MLHKRGKYQFLLTFVALSDEGALQNNPYDTRWPDSFWSTNYPRLLSIKRDVDPWDVFWCSSCVGKGGWQELNDGRLCRA